MANKKQQYVNEYGVKCYNQGFGKFGPMEQCTDGEWVRWKDVEPFLHAAELRVMTSMEYERNVQDHLEAYKRRIEEQAKTYENRIRDVKSYYENELKSLRADRMFFRKAYLVTMGALTIVSILYSQGILHA